MTGARLVARTVRGIEELVAAEVAAIGRVERIRHREVWFTAQPGPAVLSLRTADDVFLVGRVFGGVGHTRADLSRVTRAVRGLPVDRLLALRAACGGPPLGPGAEVVASFVGRRNFNRFDLEDAVGRALPGYVSRRGGVPPPSVRSWRLTVVGDEAVLALRVAGRPLHRRPYRTRSVPGSLHPPLAASLVRLADVSPGMTVLDPCCGAGTLLLESAARRGAALLESARRCAALLETGRHRGAGRDACLGMDASPAAVACARANGVPALCVADAGRLPVASGSVDRVLVNPPWGQQVAACGSLSGSPERLWRSIRRVLRPDGLVAAVVPSVALPGFRVRTSLEVRVSGRPAWLVLASPV